MTSVVLDSVGKRFEGGLVAVEGVDLTVQVGEIVALIGPSGCGKSTLLRLVAGLDQPTTGSVTIAGHPVTGPNRDVGVVFQEPRLMPWLDVADNVGFGLASDQRPDAARLVEEAIERVGLSAFSHVLPRQLSGGMAQRVAIARALVVKPPVLLLDEPFSALDAFTRRDLQDHLLDVWSWYRPTMLLVTHDLDEAAALADRIVVLGGRPGRVAAEMVVELERPRDRGSSSFAALRADLLATFESSPRSDFREDLHA